MQRLGDPTGESVGRQSKLAKLKYDHMYVVIRN